MFRPATFSAVAVLVQIVLGPSALLIAQQEDPKPAEASQPEPESLKIEIADEPKTIDPATLLPEELAAPATVEFTEASLKEVLNWIKTERKISVILDEAALTEYKILVSEPVTDRLNNEPLYLLLNRLKSLQLAWYMEGKILHITTEVKADSIMKTVPHNLGEFFDAGFKPQAMTQTIMQAAGGLWEEDGDGEGHLILLGDVVFLRQTDKVHLEVEGLLAALRKHGRRTYVLDPPQHEMLRQKLEQVISVDFQDTPLFAAIQELSRQVEADIRLDGANLRGVGVRHREPVTLSLTDQKLSVVLTALLSKFNLTWVFLDGVIVITSEDESREIMLTAVYDVRDLCRDEGESMALENAIYSQTQSGWEMEGNGTGNIAFANPGTMVVRHTERVHNDLLNLLENYRLALKASKPRNRSEVDPKEVLMLYYRVPTVIAEDLQQLLPQMVKPDSWKSEDRQDAIGTITILASRPDVLEGRGIVGKSGENTKNPSAQNVFYLENSVMIIKQSRENHELITQTIRKVEYGDQLMSPTGMGGMGGGMGGMGGAGMGGMGFGGGFFSVPLRPQ